MLSYIVKLVYGKNLTFCVLMNWRWIAYVIYRIKEKEENLGQETLISNEITKLNDKTIELKTNLDLYASKTEFEEDVIEGIEEVRGCIDLENEDSFVDTDDIKKLIIKKEYMISPEKSDNPSNRKLSSALDPR